MMLMSAGSGCLAAGPAGDFLGVSGTKLLVFFIYSG